MKVFGYEAEFKDSVYIDYLLFKDKKKKVFIIQFEVSRLFSSWTYHVDKCPQISFRKMITEQLTMSRSLEWTITLFQVKTA